MKTSFSISNNFLYIVCPGWYGFDEIWEQILSISSCSTIRDAGDCTHGNVADQSVATNEIQAINCPLGCGVLKVHINQSHNRSLVDITIKSDIGIASPPGILQFNGFDVGVYYFRPEKRRGSVQTAQWTKLESSVTKSIKKFDIATCSSTFEHVQSNFGECYWVIVLKNAKAADRVAELVNDIAHGLNIDINLFSSHMNPELFSEIDESINSSNPKLIYSYRSHADDFRLNYSLLLYTAYTISFKIQGCILRCHFCASIETEPKIRKTWYQG